MLTVDLARAGIGPGARVLDVGCGGGRHAYACAKAGAEVVALDTSTTELEAVRAMLGAMADGGELDARVGAAALGADTRALPFAAGVFTHVVASEVLEHVPEDHRALTELARVLVPGGVLALSVPRAWPEAVNWLFSSEYHTNPGGHIRIYRRRQLRARLARAGFRVTAAHHAHALHTPYWWLRCVVGVARDDQRAVAAYHRLLVHAIVRRPRWLSLLERALDPFIGKSLVLYCRRGASPT